MSNFTDALWTEATFDHEAAHEAEVMGAAQIAGTEIWSFVSAAETEDDFHNRIALMGERIKAVANSVAPGSTSDALMVEAALPRTYFEDWQSVFAARQAETQARNAPRAAARAAAREGQQKTAREGWWSEGVVGKQMLGFPGSKIIDVEPTTGYLMNGPVSDPGYFDEAAGGLVTFDFSITVEKEDGSTFVVGRPYRWLEKQQSAPSATVTTSSKTTSTGWAVKRLSDETWTDVADRAAAVIKAKEIADYSGAPPALVLARSPEDEVYVWMLQSPVFGLPPHEETFESFYGRPFKGASLKLGDLSGYWESIDAALGLMRKAKSADEVIGILGEPDRNIAVGNAFFGGDGDEMLGALLDAGWRSVRIDASYYWCLEAPDGSLLSYVEGDVFKGNQLTASKKAAVEEPANITLARKVLAEGFYAGGEVLDQFSASAIVQVYEALNGDNKVKFGAMPLEQMVDIAFKLGKSAARKLAYQASETWMGEHWVIHWQGEYGGGYVWGVGSTPFGDYDEREGHAEDLASAKTQVKGALSELGLRGDPEHPITHSTRTVASKTAAGDDNSWPPKDGTEQNGGDANAAQPPAAPGAPQTPVPNSTEQAAGPGTPASSVTQGAVLLDAANGVVSTYEVNGVVDEGETVLLSVTKDGGEQMDLRIPKTEPVQIYPAKGDQAAAPVENPEAAPAANPFAQKAEGEAAPEDGASKPKGEEAPSEGEKPEGEKPDEEKDKKKPPFGGGK